MGIANDRERTVPRVREPERYAGGEPLARCDDDPGSEPSLPPVRPGPPRVVERGDRRDHHRESPRRARRSRTPHPPPRPAVPHRAVLEHRPALEVDGGTRLVLERRRVRRRTDPGVRRGVARARRDRRGSVPGVRRGEPRRDRPRVVRGDGRHVDGDPRRRGEAGVRGRGVQVPRAPHPALPRRSGDRLRHRRCPDAAGLRLLPHPLREAGAGDVGREHLPAALLPPRAAAVRGGGRGTTVRGGVGDGGVEAGARRGGRSPPRAPPDPLHQAAHFRLADQPADRRPHPVHLPREAGGDHRAHGEAGSRRRGSGAAGDAPADRVRYPREGSGAGAGGRLLRERNRRQPLRQPPLHRGARRHDALPVADAVRERLHPLLPQRDDAIGAGPRLDRGGRSPVGRRLPPLPRRVAPRSRDRPRGQGSDRPHLPPRHGGGTVRGGHLDPAQSLPLPHPVGELVG